MLYQHNTCQSISYVRPIQGFSLFEIMMVLAVAAVLITLAVPAMGNMLAKQRLNGAQSELLSALRFAQTEALARGQAVVMVRGADDNERIIQVEDGGEVLRHISIDPRLQVLPSAKMAANPKQTIHFTTSGTINAGNRDKIGIGTGVRSALAICAPNLSGENSIDIFFSGAQLETQRREGGKGCSAPNNCINSQYCP